MMDDEENRIQRVKCNSTFLNNVFLRCSNSVLSWRAKHRTLLSSKSDRKSRLQCDKKCLQQQLQHVLIIGVKSDVSIH